MANVRRALGYSFASVYFSQIVSFVAVLIIVRLLSPAEIGVFSLATVVLFVGSFLRTFGITQYIVQIEDLTPERLRSALGAVIAMSWTTGLLLLLASEPLAIFYREPGVARVLQVVSMGFVVSPFVSVPFALLLRELKTDKTAIVNAGSVITQSGVAVGLVYMDFSYMSMAWSFNAQILVELLIVNYLRPVNFWPSTRNIFAVLRFGGAAAVSGLFDKLSQGVPELVLGRTGTMADVGMFSRGFGAVMILERIVTLAVNPVILPYFSKEFREHGSVVASFCRSVEFQTAIAWPFYAAFTAATLPIIQVLYGDQWDAAAPVAAWFGLWGAAQAVHVYAEHALVAVGKPDYAVVKGAVILVLRVLAALAGSPYGIVGIAFALALVSLLEVVATVVILKRGIDVTAGAVAMACARSGVAGAVTLVLCHGCAGFVYASTDSAWLQMLAFMGLGTVGWVGGLVLAKHPLVDEVRPHVAKLLRRSA